jgi:hypothetical protein
MRPYWLEGRKAYTSPPCNQFIYVLLRMGAYVIIHLRCAMPFKTTAIGETA